MTEPSEISQKWLGNALKHTKYLMEYTEVP